jgi:hypothetical protein
MRAMSSATPRRHRIEAEDWDGSERKRQRPKPTGVFVVGTTASLSRRPCLKCNDENALHKMERCVGCGTLAKTPRFADSDEWF